MILRFILMLLYINYTNLAHQHFVSSLPYSGVIQNDINMQRRRYNTPTRLQSHETQHIEHFDNISTAKEDNNHIDVKSSSIFSKKVEKYLEKPETSNYLRVKREEKNATKLIIGGGVMEGQNNINITASRNTTDVKDMYVDPKNITTNLNATSPTQINQLDINKPEVTNLNATSPTQVNKLDISKPGVVKRGLIVFGGFAVLGIAYIIFYRNKNKNSSSNSNAMEANQFRYGVLESDEQRGNMELSRIPLTMESDEDEDEDLEIFDLEQKKKSMSYTNLQTHDADIDLVYDSALNSSRDTDRDNLLLDIEDRASDSMINWSSSGSKSIL